MVLFSRSDAPQAARTTAVFGMEGELPALETGGDWWGPTLNFARAARTYVPRANGPFRPLASHLRLLRRNQGSVMSAVYGYVLSADRAAVMVCYDSVNVSRPLVGGGICDRDGPGRRTIHLP